MTIYDGTLNSQSWPLFFSNVATDGRISIVRDTAHDLKTEGDYTYTNSNSFYLWGVIMIEFDPLDDHDIDITVGSFTFNLNFSTDSSLYTIVGTARRFFPVVLKPNETLTIKMNTDNYAYSYVWLYKMNSGNFNFNYSFGELNSLSFDTLYTYSGLIYGWVDVTVPMSSPTYRIGIYIDLYSDTSGTNKVYSLYYSVPINKDALGPQRSGFTFYILVPHGWSWKVYRDVNNSDYTVRLFEVAYVTWW